jgi:hypothetical protein
MKNKQLYIRRIERMEGALRAVEGLLGQRSTTIQDIKKRLQTLNGVESNGGKRKLILNKSYEINSRTNSR